MKRFLALLLSALFILSAMPVMAADSDATLTNVALYKQGYSTAQYDHYGPSFATNGTRRTISPDNDDQFISQAYEAWYYVDLGATYLIDHIFMDSSNANFTDNVSVYVSDDPVTDNKVPASATKVLAGSSDKWTEKEKTIDCKVYHGCPVSGRYVIVAKSSGIGTALRIGELEVYAYDAVNVAKGKTAYANTVLGDYPVSKITDGVRKDVDDGQYISNGNGDGQWTYIDLGAVYNIDCMFVEVAKTFTNNTDVYISREPVTKVTQIPSSAEKIIATEGSNWDDQAKFIAFDTPKQGRYIILYKNGGSNALRASEIEVYAKADDYLTNVALGKTATASAAESGYGANLATDGKIKESATDLNGNSQFISGAYEPWYCVDLGAVCTIDSIMLDAANVQFTENVRVYVSNEATDSAAIPASATNVWMGDSNTWGKQCKVIELATPQKGRYVIVTKPSSKAQPLRIGEIEVYADVDTYMVGANFTENDKVYAVSGTDYLSVPGKGYVFIAAAYDADDKLVDVKTAPVAVTGAALGEAISASVDFSDSTVWGDVATVKTFLWDGLATMIPVVAGEVF